ncbi:MAG: signal peptidase I [Candidatus Pacebacteria bacterium]|nr:signal peptidase I [Candidatus Paceibacterota bacterium]MDD4874777.1 signal peptidase I [Candidatus Paceibacterota bacterium]
MDYKKIFSDILAVFFVLVILLLVASLFPIPGNVKLFTVLSGSMEPAIRTGSVVAIKPANEYGIGDIITFGEISRTSVPTTHRIKDIKIDNGKTLYITKGDANNAEDQSPVSKESISGKVFFTIPFLGYGLAAIRHPIGFLLILIIPAGIIIYDQVKVILSETKKEKEDKKLEKESKEPKEPENKEIKNG